MMKKVLTLIILVLGVAMILSGAYLIAQYDGDHTGARGGLSRASTSIEFGADFYTTSAQATGLAANAVTDLYDLVAIATGIFFIFVGSMDICVTLLVMDVKRRIEKKNANVLNSVDTKEEAQSENI